VAGVAGQRRGAFTLVELLVVIGIIALLIALLMPVLKGARESAAEVRCASNQRQVGIALTAYANYNNGVLPPQQPGYTEWLQPDLHRRMSGALGKTGGTVFYCPSLSNPCGTLVNRSYNAGIPEESPEWHWNNHIAPYGYLIEYLYIGNLTAWMPQYSPEHLLGDADGDGDNREEYVIKLDEPHAARTVILADKTGQFLAKDWVMPHPAYSKNGRLNVLLADGHVESRRRDEIIERFNRKVWPPNKQMGW